MKNIFKKTSISVVALALALAFGIGGIEKTEAAEQTSYFVDVTGNGCGNNCADFYKYLASQGVSITSTKNQNTSSSNSTSNNNGSTTRSTTAAPATAKPATSYVQYPYQVYTPFASTTTSTNTKGSTSATGTINYIQYPYYGYAYFQDPTSKYDSAAVGQYPESVYIYHGKDATEQMNKYNKKTYTSTASKPGTNSGFTITSILK